MESMKPQEVSYKADDYENWNKFWQTAYVQGSFKRLWRRKRRSY